jgi:hypothetical protein
VKAEKELMKSLKELTEAPVQIVIGEVTSVDDTAQKATIKLDDDGDVTYDVRLKAIVDSESTGFVIHPAVGCKLLAAKILNVDKYVMISCSDVDKVLIDGGDDGGLVNITNLQERLSNLEKDIKAINDTFNLWVIPGSPDAGAALKTSYTTNWPTKNSSEGSRSDVEMKGN